MGDSENLTEPKTVTGEAPESTSTTSQPETINSVQETNQNKPNKTVSGRDCFQGENILNYSKRAC